MANGIEEFNQEANIARVTEGWQDGDRFNNPNLVPTMEVVQAIPATVMEKLGSTPVAVETIIDPWVQRRSNAQL